MRLLSWAECLSLPRKYRIHSSQTSQVVMLAYPAYPIVQPDGGAIITIIVFPTP
jgi:hypothetical protein